MAWPLFVEELTKAVLTSDCWRTGGAYVAAWPTAPPGDPRHPA